jgi:hypothetical protein
MMARLEALLLRWVKPEALVSLLLLGVLLLLFPRFQLLGALLVLVAAALLVVILMRS